MSLDVDLNSFVGVEDKSREAQGEANRKLVELQGRIRQGESTGDPLADFVILYYFGGPEFLQELRGLQGKLAAHPGELVLLEERYSATKHERDDPEEIVYFGGGSRTETLGQLALGRIREPLLRTIPPPDGQQLRYRLNPTFFDLELVTDHSLVVKLNSHGWSFSDKFELYLPREEPLPERDRGLMASLALLVDPQPYMVTRRAEEVGEKSEASYFFSHPLSLNIRLHAYKIHVGNEEVDAFFAQHPLVGYRGKSRDFVFPELKTMLLDDKTFAEYVEKRTKEKEEKRISEQNRLALDIFEAHYQLVKEAERLQSERESIPGQARQMTEDVTFTGEVTARDKIQGDYEDLLILSLARGRSEWEDKYSQVRRRLEEAKKLGLDQETRAIALPHFPGVKVEIGAFVKGLSETYKI